MGPIRRLRELSALAAGDLPPEEAVERALPLLQEALASHDVYLAYGESAGFRCFGTCAELGLTDIALWLVYRDLTSHGGPRAFDLLDGRVVNFRSARSRRHCEYVAALIPLASSAGDMLIARGSWPQGFGMSRLHVLEAALPASSLLLERRLDSSRAERQRNQLSALANITRVLAEAEDLETVLTSIAVTIATVTGIDYVSIDVTDSEGNIKLRCFNSPREGTEQLRDRWKRGAGRPDPVRDAVISTRRPMLFHDAQNDERIPVGGRNFFTRTLLRSTAVLPLLTKDEVVGVLAFASHRPLEFSAPEVELLEGLASQVASAVKGIQLYQELATSRQELQRLNLQLQESMGIEHHLARTDALTGIPNRRFIDETVNTEVARAARYGQRLSVVMADLDDLKGINDTYGHQTGDEALRLVAGLGRESCRHVDVVGRYGGDEFVFVLPATGRDDATTFAERFRQQLADSRAPSRLNGARRVTVSLGVAEWDKSSMKDAGCLVRQADRAMYEAKAAGRNRTMVAVGDGARAA